MEDDQDSIANEAEEKMTSDGMLHPELRGDFYLSFLQHLHTSLQPKSYLEIGSRTGASLSAAKCDSIAIDPKFKLKPEFLNSKKKCFLFQMTSDDFFRSHDPVALFNAPLDFVFLDGMHLAEFLLRDFTNVERYCRPNSVVAIHDCVPLDLAMARRIENDPIKSSFNPGWWTGDVWKVIAALKLHRPGLRISIFDAPPTGLVLITGLDPDSKILSSSYFDIVNEFSAMRDDSLREFISNLDLISTASLKKYEDIAKYFWL